MKKLVKDWKFYEENGKLMLYAVAEDERGIQVGKLYEVGEGGVDPSTLNLVPNGGTAGQALKKFANGDGKYEWQDCEEVPTNGTQGQVLTKMTGENYGWADIPRQVGGGQIGSILKKYGRGDSDYQFEYPLEFNDMDDVNTYKHFFTGNFVYTFFREVSMPTTYGTVKHIDLTSGVMIPLEVSMFVRDERVNGERRYTKIPEIDYDTGYQILANVYANYTDKKLYLDVSYNEQSWNGKLTTLYVYGSYIHI